LVQPVSIMVALRVADAHPGSVGGYGCLFGNGQGVSPKWLDLRQFGQFLTSSVR
jgi:hypothetical protein